MTTDARPFLADHGVAPYLSERYVRVDTNAVIAALAEEGFEVANIRTDNVRKRDPRWARHEVDFRSPSMGGALADGTVPRVLFINSHNGTTRARFLLGLFRFVCTNGMIVGTTWGSERVTHAGDSARQVVDRIREQSKNTSKLFEAVRRWEKVKMTRSAQLDFAAAAMDLRFGKDAHKRYDPQELLVPLRQEDERDTLWNVFNRIQEHGTRTRLIGTTTNGRRVQTRGINSISVDHAWNQRLWDLAEQVAA